ncbi:WW domain-binding protein 2-like [Saccoglossus kowalevskii]|uniref:WW domain-binding protein 2-like n=1 Tax=Saccoglossus kowalevskii TaxID=10224 RepID=A0ABM0GSD9_SACKO|nr:PREDICTED: WW domain-binding protein 2-like [Saccoglossus kowalevskii]
MALNQSTQGDGVVLYQGENILMHQDDVELEFDMKPMLDHFRGSKKGKLYLTTQRLIFHNQNRDLLVSFAMPFYYMKEVDIKQPVFGANYIKGRIKAQPGGGWEGAAFFKLTFKTGGAIELGERLMKVASKNGNVPPGPRIPAAAANYPPPGAYPPPPMMMNGGAPQPAAYGFDYSYASAPPYPMQDQSPEAPPPYSSVAPTAPPVSEADAKAREAMSNGGTAYYSPTNPQNVYMPPAPPQQATAPPPPYSTAHNPEDKKNQ